MMGIIEFRQEIERLDLRKGEYAIFGSGTLLALEIIHYVTDIDVIVTKKEYERLKIIFEVKEEGSLIYKSNSHTIEIFNKWMGLNVDRIIREAIVIQQIPYASLLDVLMFKYIMSRPKDIEHINQIRKYLS